MSHAYLEKEKQHHLNVCLNQQEMRTLTTNEIDVKGVTSFYLFSVWTQHVSYK